MSAAVTTRQQQVLDYCKAFLCQRQRPPTRNEIAQHCGVTSNAAQLRLLHLERKGLISLADRSIFIVGLRLTRQG